MSTRIVPAKSTLRQNNLKCMNMMVHAHDMICDCPTPLQHIVILIFQQEPDLDFKPIEKDLIKKCLTGEHTDRTATDNADDGVEEGLLDALFKEDFGEEDNTG